MKIQCDVCSKAEAAVFCTADEAALCASCDHRVHHANKLASKHHRFSLLSSSKNFPLCDICQEKRAFLFCQQDRAILCRECDHPIHAANEHTQRHNRFLLTGVKLSNTSELYDRSSTSNSVTDPKTKPVATLSSPISNQPNSTPKNSALSTTTTTTSSVSKSTSINLDNSLINNHGGLTSSISEYLIETLPGWHIEDFLDNCKADDGMLLPLWSSELDESSNNSMSSFSPENMGIWVPQAPAPLYPSEMGKALLKDADYKESTNLKAINNGTTPGTTRRWSDDGSFTVPQINFPSSGSKRTRSFW